MIATVFINGHKVGSLTYEHPTNADGKTVHLPTPGENPGDVSVQINADDGEHAWFGMADLLDIS